MIELRDFENFINSRKLIRIVPATTKGGDK